MDDIDYASETEQFHNEISIRNRKLPEHKFTGKCAWCGDKVPAGEYCSPECRDDHAVYLNSIKQRPTK